MRGLVFGTRMVMMRMMALTMDGRWMGDTTTKICIIHTYPSLLLILWIKMPRALRELDNLAGGLRMGEGLLTMGLLLGLQTPSTMEVLMTFGARTPTTIEILKAVGEPAPTAAEASNHPAQRSASSPTSIPKLTPQAELTLAPPAFITPWASPSTWAP